MSQNPGPGGDKCLPSPYSVFMFTSALFLSGYVLQQQTLRDLRAAIQPKSTPEAARLYLPTQFALQPTPSPKADTAENMEGATRDVEAIEEPETSEWRSTSDTSFSDTSLRTDSDLPDNAVGGSMTANTQSPLRQDGVSPDTVIDPTLLAMLEETPPSGAERPKEVSPLSSIESQPMEKPISRAERRKKIKEEILAAGEGEGSKGYQRRQY